MAGRNAGPREDCESVGGAVMSPMNRFRFLPFAALAAATLSVGCGSSYPPSGPYDEPDYRYSHPYYPPHETRYGYSYERFSALAHELDDRAARVHALAEDRAAGLGRREQEFLTRIHHFSDQVRAFHERYESGRINSRERMTDEINHLYEDARETHQALRQANVFPDVWDEWQGVIRVLERMRNVVGA